MRHWFYLYTDAHGVVNLLALDIFSQPNPTSTARTKKNWFLDNSWKLLLLSDMPRLLFGKRIHCFITLPVHPRYRKQV